MEVAKKTHLDYASAMENEIDSELVEKLTDVLFSKEDNVSPEEHKRRVDALEEYLKPADASVSRPPSPIDTP